MTIIVPMDNEKYIDYINRILASRVNIRDSSNYQERHHITPKCMGGLDQEDNLIYLYGQEHYYAHKLLAAENPEEESLQYAWWNMCHCKKAGKEAERVYNVNPDEYAESRKRFSKLISERFSGENAYWYGKHQSEESNRKRSAKLSGEKNPMFGHKHSQSTKDYISTLNSGKRMGVEHPRAKPVMCINTGEIFDTAVQAAEYCHLKSRSSITLCCKGDKLSAGKDPQTGEPLKWKYVE